MFLYQRRVLTLAALFTFGASALACSPGGGGSTPLLSPGSISPTGLAPFSAGPPDSGTVQTRSVQEASTLRAAATVQAPTVAAFALYDSAGIDTHLQRSTYSSRYPQMETLLSNLGISHIRDSFHPTLDTSYTNELKRLYQQYGIDFILNTTLGENGALWAQYAGAMGGALKGLEGINEPNNGVSNWNPASTRQMEKDMWTATHGGQPSLTGIPVINSSVLNCDGNAAYGDQSATTDFATMHKYWPGFNPNGPGYGSGTCGSSDKYGSIGYNVHSVQQSSHHPIYVTEVGFCTANIHKCLPQSVAATYEPEIFLTFFLYAGAQGSNGGTIRREYLYEITSEDSSSFGGDLGLTDPGFNPKPMYYAVSGLMKRLKDKPGSVRGQIAYTLGGTTANLRAIPLTYTNGTYGMILFQDTQVWDPNGSATAQGSPITVPVDHPTLSVTGQNMQNVTASTYGGDGKWADMAISGTQPITLNVGQNMVLVRWSNGGGPTPTPLPSATATATATATPTGGPSPTASPVPTASVTASPLPTATATAVATATPSPTAIPTPTAPPTAPPSAPPTPGPGISIDAGGNAAAPFLSDRDYSGGQQASYYRSSIDVSAVTNPAPQAVYQTGRTGKTFSYTIPNLVPGGAYDVRLHFAENHWDDVGQRVFSMTISGAAQGLTDYDILAAAGGAHKAVAVDFPTVIADPSGKITLAFTSSVDQALVNGIEVH